MERTVTPAYDAASQLIDEILEKIDEKRGTMSRIEFARLLIHSRLEKYCRFRNYDDEREIYLFVVEIIEMLSVYLEMIYKSKTSVPSTRRHNHDSNYFE